MHPRLLALAAVLALTGPSLLPAQQGESPQMRADMQEVLDYKLTEASFAKLVKVQDNIYATVKANPDLAKKYGNPQSAAGDDASLDAIAKQFDKVPEVKQAIAKAGLTPRQYLVASMALFQAAMANSIMEMPGADRSQLTATLKANAAFLKAHAAEMAQMQARGREIDLLTRKARGESDDAPAAEAPDSSRTRRR